MSKLPTTEEILDSYQHNMEYPSYIHEHWVLEAMETYANLHTQALKEENDRLEEENKKLRFQMLYGRH